MIGPDGGTVESGDGYFRLEIPPGALSEDTEITVVSQPVGDLDEALADYEPVVAYKLEPAGLEFAEPALAVISVASEELVAETSAEETPIYGIALHSVGQEIEVPAIGLERVIADRVEFAGDVLHFTDILVGTMLKGRFELPCTEDCPAGTVYDGRASITVPKQARYGAPTSDSRGLTARGAVEVVPDSQVLPTFLAADDFFQLLAVGSHPFGFQYRCTEEEGTGVLDLHYVLRRRENYDPEAPAYRDGVWKTASIGCAPRDPDACASEMISLPSENTTQMGSLRGCNSDASSCSGAGGDVIYELTIPPGTNQVDVCVNTTEFTPVLHVASPGAVDACDAGTCSSVDCLMCCIPDSLDAPCNGSACSRWGSPPEGTLYYIVDATCDDTCACPNGSLTGDYTISVSFQ